MNNTKIFKIEFSSESENLIKFLEKYPDQNLETKDIETKYIETKDIKDINRLMTNHIISDKDVKNITNIKSELDDIFNNNLSKYYYTARRLIFPEDVCGSNNSRNRAGDKLSEINDAVNIFDFTKKTSPVFLDVAAGPGAWSDLLLKNYRWSGYGMTLNVKLNNTSDIWYDSLMRHKRWKSVWGEDGTGNLYYKKNIDHAIKEINDDIKSTQSIMLVMGDGGFHLDKDENGNNQESLQELTSFQLILSEFVIAIQLLEKNGNFVCKLFDTFSDLTISLIYCMRFFFDEVYIVKPIRSRSVNSERYVVCKNFISCNIKVCSLLKDYLIHIHENWSDDNAITSLIPWNIISDDQKFITSFKKSVNVIYNAQKNALRKVIDKTNQLIKNKK